MGLKNFLKQRGFIEDEPENKQNEPDNTSSGKGSSNTDVVPTYFPLSTETTAGSDFTPSFVTPIPQSTAEKKQLDPTFVKFFEDELSRSNFPGLDYFEFRQQLVKTQQKMSAKGIGTPEVILQAVLTGFETQEIQPASLVESAKKYKDIIKQKNADFLKGAAAEKNNQLQKRQTVLQSHNDSINKMQQQLQQLELQRKQIEDAYNREKTQMEVDKTLGQEGIEKIEKAEKLITLAHDYIQSTIDDDIKKLQSV